MGIPRQHTGKYTVQFASSVNKLRDILSQVVDQYQIRDVLLTENGDVKPYARILVNGRSFQFVGGIDVELHEGDTIALIYPWLGHEDF